MHILVVFFSVLLLALGLTYLSILFAVEHNIIDRPDDFRKFHSNPTPSTGGLAIGVSFLIGLIVMNLAYPAQNESIVHFIWYFSAGAVLIFATGIIDDIFTLQSKVKFFLQTVAAIITIVGIKIEFFPNFGDADSINTLSLISLCALLWFWIVANTNTMNLIDGVDSLAGTLALLNLFGLALIANLWQVQDALLFIIPLSAAILGFLVFNKPPASVFMGDSGSLLIGYALSVISLVLAFHAPHWKYTFALVLLPAVQALDTLFSIIRRIKNKKSMFEPDHSHIHHVLQKYFKSPALTVITLGSISLIFVLTSVLLANTHDDTLYFIVLAVLSILVISVSVIYYIKMESINSIVLNDELNRRIIRRITNGKRAIGPHKSGNSHDDYIKTFKN